MTNDHEYIVLKALMTDQEKEWKIQELYEIIKDEIGWQDYLQTLEYFHKKEFTDRNCSDEKISNIGKRRYDAIKSEYQEIIADKKTEKKFKYLNLILNIVFGVSTLILGWLTLHQDNKIELLKNAIEMQNNLIDKKTKVADSLTIILQNLKGYKTNGGNNK